MVTEFWMVVPLCWKWWGMGHEARWGWGLLATSRSWCKWKCSIGHNSLNFTPKICAFLRLEIKNLKTRVIGYINTQRSNFLYRDFTSLHFLDLDVHSTSPRFCPYIIILCSLDLSFMLFCANHTHTKNIIRRLKFSCDHKALDVNIFSFRLLPTSGSSYRYRLESSSFLKRYLVEKFFGLSKAVVFALCYWDVISGPLECYVWQE